MAEARFAVHDTPLAGLKRVVRTRIGDTRGFLSRLYCAGELAAAGFTAPVAQINHTLTRATGSIRGLHFQHPPYAEDKFVSVLAGAVFDVAIDLRAGSPTFLHWHGEHLSADNATSLFIPKGFAHGFQTLTADCELLYLHTAPYAAGAEGGLNPLDPRLAIAWPLAITEISARDRGHPLLTPDFTGIPS
ncbi:dTDP-4-dehydrorhamnose 3,5-epimerase [Sphingomonas sp. KR1UV-12]|uniref:dTDP-4-dehydrorhamnose 3,5-epimerase n=1 Tax=Sphingomonas aurea TaxID=3063994 RepID=A0ABT9EPA4_9SPHN|nr:dTDP-4-dehydrorhamnose 3,5-epimerase [Sphingomonas sp. KR1UV-12]MDP1028797.1 dTDP-4-dehydrorhamnose 3,5-epimerase [Sphingomonas sp. KR1UV-12]